MKMASSLPQMFLKCINYLPHLRALTNIAMKD